MTAWSCWIPFFLLSITFIHFSSTCNQECYQIIFASCLLTSFKILPYLKSHSFQWVRQPRLGNAMQCHQVIRAPQCDYSCLFICSSEPCGGTLFSKATTHAWDTGILMTHPEMACGGNSPWLLLFALFLNPWQQMSHSPSPLHLGPFPLHLGWPLSSPRCGWCSPLWRNQFTSFPEWKQRLAWSNTKD